MTARRIGVVVIVGAFSLFLIGAGLFVFRKPAQEPFLAEATLADGIHRVRLLRTSDGPLDYDWKDPISPTSRKYLPALLLPPEAYFTKVAMSGKISGQTPGWSFLFRTADENGNYANVPVEAVIEESTGYLFSTEERSGPEVQQYGVTGITVAQLPRRDARLRFLIYERGKRGSSRPAVIEVDNPAYQAEAPVWVAEHLPTKKVDGDHTVELKSFGVSKKGELELVYSVDGRKPRKASRSELWLEDATGNRGDVLSPFEPAWKIHLLAQAMLPQFPTFHDDEVWDLGEVLRPSPGEYRRINESRLVNGTRLEVIAALGEGRYEFQDDSITSISMNSAYPGGISHNFNASGPDGRPQKAFECQTGKPLLLIRAKVEPKPSQGRAQEWNTILVLIDGKHPFHRERIPSDPRFSTRTFTESLDVWRDSKASTHVRIAVLRQVKAEFYVQPPEQLKAVAARHRAEADVAGNGN